MALKPNSSPRTCALRCLMAALMLASGCTEDLPAITFIKQLESIGARVEVDGDATRSNPQPGESFTYRPAIVVPEREADLSGLSSLAVECTAPSFDTGGLPLCQELVEALESSNGEVELAGDGLAQFAGELLAAGAVCDEARVTELPGFGARLHCVLGAPVFSMIAPADQEGADRLIRGIYCNGGQARIDIGEGGTFFACGGDNLLDSLRFFGEVDVQAPGDVDNAHPDGDALAIALKPSGASEFETWPAWSGSEPPSAEDCEADGSELPTVRLARTNEIRLRFPESDVQRLDGEREFLEISSYANAGDLERRFTLFAPEDEPDDDGLLTGTLDWDAPSVGDNEAYERRDPTDPVRFHFALRDQRGGFTLLERYLCLDVP